MSLRILSAVLVAVSSFESVSARLLSSQVLSRHGTRAPNPVVEKLCPNDKHNLLQYHDMYISLAGLTGNGMRELLALGQATRAHYTGFLSDHFDNTEIFIQAVAEDRTLQSAVAWGQGLYPPKSTPGYDPSLPVPLPVYSIPNGRDNLLEARKGGCKDRLKREAAAWDAKEGKALWDENAELLDKLGSLCGVQLKEVIKGSGDNYGDAIKDITDALMFDYQEHFTPLTGLTLKEFASFRSIAIRQLLGRIVGTNEQRTYMNGELPDALLSNFRDSVSLGGLKMFAYHGHREMLYAFASFFGIDFDIKFPGLPKLAIPPATTLFVELHQSDDINDIDSKIKASDEIENTLQRLGYSVEKKNDISGNTVNPDLTKEQAPSQLFVRINLWVPCYINGSTADGAYTLGELRHGAECPMIPLPLSTCGGKSDCPFYDFAQIITKQIQSSGDWASLCSFKSSSDLVEQLTTANINEQHLHTAVSLFSIAFSVAIIAAVTLAAFVMCRHRFNKNHDDMNRYSDYEDSEYTAAAAAVAARSSSASSRVVNANENTSLLSHGRQPALVSSSLSSSSGYRSEDSLP